MSDRPLRRPLVVAAVTCLVPYLGLVALFWVGHQSATEYPRPKGLFLTILTIGGGVVPLTAVALVFSRLVRDSSRFRPVVLAELYFALILVFASLYSLVQSASESAAFANAPVLWESGTGLGFDEHMTRLHSVFGTMLYLSVVTVTTLGYGDITPNTTPARFLTAVQALLGVSFITVSVGHYFSVCTHRR